MPTPTITILPPPGRSTTRACHSPPFSPRTYPSVPPTFLSALAVRFAVFVDEQHCSAAEEIDKDDRVSWHWVAYVIEDGAAGNEYRRIPAGTIRLVPVAPVPTHQEDSHDAKIALGPKHGKTGMWDGKEAFVKLGRMATLKEYRKLGLGRRLVDEAIEWLERNHEKVVGKVGAEANDKETERMEAMGKWDGLVLVHAQKVIERFWASCGFVRDRGMGEWWEDGIEHVAMWRRVMVR
jgi:predicted GNAT family N-acyltransferase